MTRLRRLLPAVLLVSAATPAPADTFTWTAAGGGIYQIGLNWNNGAPPVAPPGTADTALFNLGGTYTVTLAGSAAATGFTHQQGNLTLAVGAGQTYQVTGANAFTVGNTNGQTATLAVGSGTLNAAPSAPNMPTGGIGVVAGSTGTLAVNSGAAFTTSHICQVGAAGDGTVTVNGSATLGQSSRLGTQPGAVGRVIVSGPGSSFSAPEGLYVGYGGTGTLAVNANGTAAVNNLLVALNPGSNGVVTVGAGSGTGPATLTVTGNFTLAQGGTGTLHVNGGGTLTGSGAVVIGADVGGVGAADVSGAWNHSGGSISVGSLPGSLGNLTVNVGGTLTVTGAANGITVRQGAGTLTLAGGTVTTPNLTAAAPILTDGVLNVTGGTFNNLGTKFDVAAAAGHAVAVNLLAGATFVPFQVLVGGGGSNTLTVQGGSTLTTTRGGTIGLDGSTAATQTVSGAGSAWNNSNSPIAVGGAQISAESISPGSGTLNVLAGGAVTTGNQDLRVGTGAAGAHGTVNVAGGGTLNAGTANVSVGDVGGATGALNIGGDGTVSGGPTTGGTGTIGRVAGATGVVTLAGAGPAAPALWTPTTLAVGGGLSAAGGTGTLTINAYGRVTTTSLVLWPDGTVNLAGGTLEVQSVTPGGLFNGTGGTLRFTASAATGRAYNLGPATLEAAAGVTLTLSGALVNGGFLRGAGTFVVTGGTALSGTSTSNSTAVAAIGAGTFAAFGNGGALTVTSPAAAPTAFNGFINQGSGTVAVAAGGRVNAADFQTYGVVTVGPGSTAIPSQLTNTGGSPLFFNGGSRTFVGTPATAGTFAAGIDLNGKNAVVAGGLLVNNGFVVDSAPGSPGRVVADFGALVKGAGFYQSPVMTQNGGRFQAGNSPGTASFGSFTFGPGGVDRYVFSINDADGTAGQFSGWGLIAAVRQDLPGGSTPGDFAWAATSAARLTVALETLVNGNAAGPMADFDPAQPYAWPAVIWAGTYTGPADAADLVATTTFDTSGFLNPVGGVFGWRLDAGSQTLSLTYTPVPEPGTFTLAGLAAVAWVVQCRLRHPPRRSATLSA